MLRSDAATVEPLAVEDGQVIPIGSKRLRFLLAPFCHAWEGLIVYEETEKLLFSSDLFMQKGEETPYYSKLPHLILTPGDKEVFS